MKNVTLTIVYFIVGFSLIAISCKEDQVVPPTCGQEATFYSTATCFGEVAVEINGGFLSLENFSEFAETDDFKLGDRIRIDYTIVQTAPEGLLCGPTVVADLAELSCFERLD